MHTPTSPQIRAWFKARGIKANVAVFDKVRSKNMRIVFPEMRALNGEPYRQERDAKLLLLSELCREFGMFNVLREQNLTWTSFSGASIFLYWSLYGFRIDPQPAKA